MRTSLVLLCVIALLSMLNAIHGEPVKEVAARGSNTSCCNQCVCTKSIPPQCRCLDVKEYCYSSCTRCLCTRSIPPQCRCVDVKDKCVPPSCLKMDIEQIVGY